jgi:SAM-dependent methyltransferase
MSSAAELLRIRGHYGIDAPYVPRNIGAGGAALALGAVLAAVIGFSWWPVLADAAGASLASTGLYLYCTRRGKFVVWARILASLGLRGDERALDMGCGRGAVLVMVAKLLPRGHVVGLDLWKTSDQSGNDPAATLANARAEGVADRVELVTGDMRAMPLPDRGFDLVTGSLAIHNITDAAGRRTALDEMIRVLRPAGRIVIVDIRATAEYAAQLRERGLQDVVERSVGWQGWFGGPWVACRVVMARAEN